MNVIYGVAGTGLDAAGNQFWSQDTAGVRDSAESEDLFGNALASGDLSGDGVDDLAIGVLTEDLGANNYAGAVNILYGTAASGLDAAADDFLNQDSNGILGHSELGDQFGDALAIGDMDGDGTDDLAVGVPEEDLLPGAAAPEAGTVNVVYGAAGGITSNGDQRWDQDSTGSTTPSRVPIASATRSVQRTSTATGSTTSRSGLPTRRPFRPRVRGSSRPTTERLRSSTGPVRASTAPATSSSPRPRTRSSTAPSWTTISARCSSESTSRTAESEAASRKGAPPPPGARRTPRSRVRAGPPARRAARTRVAR